MAQKRELELEADGDATGQKSEKPEEEKEVLLAVLASLCSLCCFSLTLLKLMPMFTSRKQQTSQVLFILQTQPQHLIQVGQGSLSIFVKIYYKDCILCTCIENLQKTYLKANRYNQQKTQVIQPDINFTYGITKDCKRENRKKKCKLKQEQEIENIKKLRLQIK